MKILIVDDSLVYRKAIVKMLRTQLKDVIFIEAENGEVAFNLLKKHTPDFILLDLLMPVMSGQDFLKKMKIEGYKSKIVVISSDVQTPVKKEVKELGAIYFINKPLTPEKALCLTKIIKGE